MTRNEAVLQTELTYSLLEAGHHPVEIPDDSKKNYRFGTIVAATAKPYDLGVQLKNDVYCALELKYQDSARFPYAKITDSEHVGLKAVTRISGRAFVLIHFHFRMGPKQLFMRPGKFVDEVWGINYQDLYRLSREAHRSVTFANGLEGMGFELKRVGDERWDLTNLISAAARKRPLKIS